MSEKDFDPVMHEAIEEIRIDYDDSMWNPPSEKYQDIVTERAEEIKSRGGWDGGMTRVNSSHEREGTLYMDLQRSSYFRHSALVEVLDPENTSKSLFVASLVEVLDDDSPNGYSFAFGLRENVERHGGMFGIAAGSVDPDDDSPDGIPSPGAAMVKELYEEYGATPTYIERGPEVSCMMSEEKEPHPTLMYRTRLGIDKKEAAKLHELKTEKDRTLGKSPEHEKLDFVSSDPQEIARKLDEGIDGERKLDGNLLTPRVGLIIEDYTKNPDRYAFPSEEDLEIE